MNELTNFIISSAVLLFCIVLLWASRMLGKRKAENLPPIYNGKNANISMGTINGFGKTLCGNLFDFRSHMSSPSDYRFHSLVSSNVKYLFFTIFFIPVIPLGCYRVDTGVYHQQVSRKRQVTSYRIYGTEKWVFWEVISIYCIPGIVFSAIYFISSLCNLF